MESALDNRRLAALIIEGWYLRKSIDLLLKPTRQRVRCDNVRLDYEALKATIEKRIGASISDRHQFDSLPAGEKKTPAYQALLQHIKRLGYQVHVSQIKRHDRMVTCPCPCKKEHKINTTAKSTTANVTLTMTDLLLRHAVTDIVLVTGDGEFADVVTWFKQRGLRVWIIGSIHSCSANLIAAAGSEFIQLEDIWQYIIADRPTIEAPK